LEPALFTVWELNELTAAFAAMHRSGVDAMVVETDAKFNSAQRQITNAALGFSRSAEVLIKMGAVAWFAAELRRGILISDCTALQCG
jgi:hypothetical protein